MCTCVSHRIVSEMATDAAAPVERNLFNNLDADDIVRIFRKATINRDLISTLPPVLPKEGEIYVFDLGPDPQLWDNNKKKFR